MAISLIATTATVLTTTNVTQSFTVASGTNSILTVRTNAQSTQITGVTYNGVSLTPVYQEDTGSYRRPSLWYLVAPPVGTFNVVLAPTTSQNKIITIQQWDGVDQGTPFGTPATGVTGTGVTSSSVTVTSVAGDMVLDGLGTSAGSSGWTAGGSQVSDQSATNTGTSHLTASGSSTGMTWTWTTSSNYRATGVAMKPAAAVTTQPDQIVWIGL